MESLSGFLNFVGIEDHLEGDARLLSARAKTRDDARASLTRSSPTLVNSTSLSLYTLATQKH